MTISHPFIARPVATTLLALAVLIGGLLGFRALPVASLPQVDFPTIVVTTTLPGADPETMSALVTAPLERPLGQIPALAAMTSTSSFGRSQITLQFELERDIDGAAQDVQAAINAASASLPRSLPYPPVYAKVNPADTPIMTLALTSPSVPLRDLSDAADSLLGQKLSEIDGVGRVSLQGGLKPAVRVAADLSALSSKGISLEDLRNAVSAANVSAPKGSLDGARQTYAIAANDQITSAKAYALITIAFRNGAPVLLRDVARVEDGFENQRIGAWLNDKSAIILDIQRQPGANVVATADRIRAQLPGLSRALPSDATLAIVSDRTETIRASVLDVQFTLALSVGLVILVVFLFLRTWSATLIAGIALPLSLIGTFALMWLAGFSLNNLSLMALTIGTGFVVDDAIVMIENIARHRENGLSRLEAAYRGAGEIGFTVVSLTASLLAVFIPLLFMSGLVGRMFREFALTLSIAVVVSALVSLTLTPMMCARWLKGEPSQDGAAKRPSLIARLGDKLAQFYARSLQFVLRHERLTMAVTLATLALTFALYAFMPKSFLPDQDTGLINVVIRVAPDASFQVLTRLQAQANAAIRTVPEVAAIASVAGTGSVNPTPNAATLSVTLMPHAKRQRSAQAIARDIEEALAPIPGITAIVREVQEVQIATRASWSQYQYTLTGGTGTEVRLWLQRLLARLREDPRFRAVASIEEDEGLAVKIDVDRARVGQFGVSVQNVSDTLNDAFAQRQISTIYGQANQYRVVLEADPRFRSDPEILQNMRFPGLGGAQVPLASFAHISRVASPLAVSRQAQFPAATVSFDLGDGVALGEAVEAIQAIERDIGLPESIARTFSGNAAEFNTALSGQPWLILAAVIAIYIVLGMLYESFIHPITILSTLPSAGIGALLALLAVGEHLTVIGLIGIVLLMGIVKKNAILMIDFALEAERHAGKTPREAIVEACRLRFRPIMMTTLAALFGALPLALAEGPGAEFRVPLGVSIIGGLVLSQILTLYTTPIVYLALDRFRRRGGQNPAAIAASEG